MDRVLLIGSGNRDKVAELAELLRGLSWTVRSLRDYPPVDEPVEDGDTFESNAAKKALHYGKHLGVHCVADDSGLMVDALGGAPGVFSARYAGEGCSYADNNVKLLGALADIDERGRTARFICCAALAFPDGSIHSETGTVSGRIAFECRGANGFGYDPLFIPDGYDQTFGELPPTLKQRISHRARAFTKLRNYVASLT